MSLNKLSGHANKVSIRDLFSFRLEDIVAFVVEEALWTTQIFIYSAKLYVLFCKVELLLGFGLSETFGPIGFGEQLSGGCLGFRSYRIH
jgi:hypothetical protein